MLQAIIKRLKRDRRGVSNVIVVVLSLILVVVIVANVVLWSYQMNQFDWERMQERIKIADAKSVESFSPWFVTENEYTTNIGSRIAGSYMDTQFAEDGYWETFQEELSLEPPRFRLFINGSFAINVGSYPLNTIRTVEILVRYNASDTMEKWYLKAYNWTSHEYSDNEFNNTSGSQPSTPSAWMYYAVNLTEHLHSYVRDDGVMWIQFNDGTPELPSETRTKISIDLLRVRVKWRGASFTFDNEGSLTVHIISLWVISSTHHKRYDVDFFVNSGENSTYTQRNISLEIGNLVKTVTERGNIAVSVSN